MKAADLRQMSEQELAAKLLELRKDQFNLRMQKASGELGQSHLLGEAKRDIARVKTLLREKRANV